MAYIGRAPGDTSVTIARQTYTVTTSTQSLFTFGAGYKPGLVEVYLNGVKLIDGTDYTATNGSTITLTAAAVNSDVLEIVAYKAFNLGQVNSSADNFHVGRDLSVGGKTTLSGNLTGVAATFSGNVNVGGVLTYEDVANVDSVGIITAQSGIHVTGGNVGIGTNIPAQKLHIHNNGASRILLKRVGGNPSEADIRNEGELLTFTQNTDGITFNTGSGTPTERLRITSTGDIGVNCEPFNNAGINLHIHGDNASAELRLTNTTTGTGSNGGLLQQSGNSLYLNNTESGNLIFENNGSERARITSTGQFNVGSGSFVVESDGDISTNVRSHGHIELDSTGTFSSPKVKLFANTGSATFAGTVISGGDPNAGANRGTSHNEYGTVRAANTSGSVWEGYTVNTATTTSSINDDGSATFAGIIKIGTTAATSNTDRLLQVGDTSLSAAYIEVRTSTSGGSGVVFSDGVDGSDTGYRGTIEYAHSTDGMSFKTNGTQKVTIDSSGNMGVQGNVDASGYMLNGLTALP